MAKLYRQGDILFRRIGALPAGERKLRRNGVIVEGEVTGHAHRIGDLASAEVYDLGEGCFLSVGPSGVSIVHEEHKAIELPPGNYEVRRQREYTPEAIRNVAD